jgi:DNA polymerase/3'-5' exonuclease PolX
MLVAIYHDISDPKKFGEVVEQVNTMIQEGKLPSGIKPLSFLPSTDMRKCHCLWESASVDSLKRFLEPITGSGSRNEYFEVNRQIAQGVPEPAPMRAAA